MSAAIIKSWKWRYQHKFRSFYSIYEKWFCSIDF